MSYITRMDVCDTTSLWGETKILSTQDGLRICQIDSHDEEDCVAIEWADVDAFMELLKESSYGEKKAKS